MQETTTTQLKKVTATVIVNVEVYVDSSKNNDYVEQLIENAIETGQREVTLKGEEEVWFDYSRFSIQIRN
jgi:hypothetical protein